MSPNLNRLVWRELHFRRPIDAEQLVEVLRLLAHDPRRAFVVLETRVQAGRVSYLLGASAGGIDSCVRVVTSAIPGTTATEPTSEPVRRPVVRTAKISVRGTERPLRRDHVEATIAAVLSAASSSREATVVQLVLGDPRSAHLATDAVSPRFGLGAPKQRPDAASLAAQRQRSAEPSFGCVIRIGTTSSTPAPLMNLFQALSTLEAAGVQLRAAREHPDRLDAVSVPWRWPQHLNIEELAALTCWPVGETDLPGVDGLHPVVLPPATASSSAPELVVADASAPGHHDHALGLDLTGALRHLWVLGPPGVGKSVLLTNLVLQDISAGRGALYLEPKGDAIADTLARIPAHRRDNVVVLDPTDAAPVGLNPLAGGDADVRAEGLLEVFASLFGDSIGPRSRDILHSALLTMTRRGDASLPMLPLLLTHAGFRRSITQHVAADDPLALGAFWAWYESLSDAERTAAIAPVLNKVRIFTTNRRLRAVLGQRRPRFDLSQVFTENKILLVPLRAGVLGEAAARLLGSLVVAELIHAAKARAATPESKRAPVFVTIDELHQYVHINDLAEALAMFRGYGVGFRLANQTISQLPVPLREALLGTVRSRVIFQTGHRDATELAKSHAELGAADFTKLPSYGVYASLMDSNTATGYVSGTTRPLGPEVSDPDALRAASRTRYGQSLDAIEADLAALVEPTRTVAQQAPTGRKRRSS